MASPDGICVGVDVGGTKIQTVAVDADGAILGRDRRPSPAASGPSGMIAAIADSARASLLDAGAGERDLRAIGLGAPGQVDAARCIVLYATNLVGWERPVDVGTPLREALGAPVALANDVQASVTGEHRQGAGRDAASMLGVFCGTGVGGGLVLDGRLWTGLGAAGEIGHTVVRRGGSRCGCGRRGCLEAYAGRRMMEERARRLHHRGRRTRLLALMEQKGKDRMTSSVWAAALEQGDPVALDLVDRATRALGTAIASACNLVDVERVVVGGGLATRLGEPFLDAIRTAAEPQALRAGIRERIVMSELADDAGAVGAALLAGDLVR
jgi:glucokinase